MKKLTLKKITISNLNKSDLVNAKGGAVTDDCPGTATCKGTICQDTAICHPTVTGETYCECRSIDYACDQTQGCTWTCPV